MKTQSKTVKKLRLDIILLVNALAAALLSFSGIAPAAAGVAKGLCYIFLLLFLMALLDRRLQRGQG